MHLIMQSLSSSKFIFRDRKKVKAKQEAEDRWKEFNSYIQFGLKENVYSVQLVLDTFFQIDDVTDEIGGMLWMDYARHRKRKNDDGEREDSKKYRIISKQLLVTYKV